MLNFASFLVLTIRHHQNGTIRARSKQVVCSQLPYPLYHFWRQPEVWRPDFFFGEIGSFFSFFKYSKNKAKLGSFHMTLSLWFSNCNPNHVLPLRVEPKINTRFFSRSSSSFLFKDFSENKDPKGNFTKFLKFYGKKYWVYALIGLLSCLGISILYVLAPQTDRSERFFINFSQKTWFFVALL